jgi:TP901 family phage tail tape measure protein
VAFQFLFGTALLRFLADDKGLRQGTARAAKTAQVQSKKIQKSLNQNIGRELRAVGAQAGALGGRFAALGAAIASPVGIAAVGVLGLGFALKSVTSEASEFQAVFAEVRTLFDESKVATDEIREALLELPPILGSAKELTKALYQAISAGAEPAAAIKLVETAARLARAGLTSTFAAVDILTTAINAYGLESEEAARLSDILFKTVELGKTTVDALAGSLGVVIPFAAQLGISFEDLTAAVATLTKGGLDTRIAVTALRGTFVAFIKQADVFRDLGIDIFKVIGEGGLVGAFKALKKATAGNIEAIKELIPDQRALTAVLALTGVQFEEFVRIQKLVSDSAGATETAFQKEAETFKLQSEALGNAVGRLKIQLGDVLLPALTSIVMGLTQFVLRLKDAKNEVAKFLESATGARIQRNFQIIFGTVTLALGQIGKLFKESKEEISDANKLILEQAALVEELAERENEINTKAIDILKRLETENKARVEAETKRRKELNEEIVRGSKGAQLKLLEFERSLTEGRKTQETKRLELTRIINDERLRLEEQRFNLLRVLGQASLEDEIDRLRRLVEAENLTTDQRIDAQERLVQKQEELADRQKTVFQKLVEEAVAQAEAEGRTQIDLADIISASRDKIKEAQEETGESFAILRQKGAIEGKAYLEELKELGAAEGLAEAVERAGGAAAAALTRIAGAPEIDTMPIVSAYEDAFTTIERRVEFFFEKIGTAFNQGNIRIGERFGRTLENSLARTLEEQQRRGAGA